MPTVLRFLCVCFASLWVTSIAQAQLVGYTTRASFEANLPGLSSIEDFDSFSSGTTVSNGGSLGALTFAYNFGGVQIMVSDAFDTTSPSNFLGTDDADVFQDGDFFDITFALPVHAAGMYFISADPLFDGDIALTVNGTSVFLDVADLEQTLGDGGDVYFLGLIDPDIAFSTISITTFGGGGAFLYNVDDVMTAVPEPSTVFLLTAIGICGVVYHRRRRKLTRVSENVSPAD